MSAEVGKATSDDVTPRSILSKHLTGERPYDQAERILASLRSKGWAVVALDDSVRGFVDPEIEEQWYFLPDIEGDHYLVPVRVDTGEGS